MTTPLNEQLEQIVNIFSEVSGIEFTKSMSTNSWYNHLLNIRISDHYSKFTERKGTGSRDYVNPDLDYLIKCTFKSQWFARLNSNVKLQHDIDSVGAIEYVSHNEERETVKVLRLKDNKVIDYFFDRINII